MKIHFVIFLSALIVLGACTQSAPADETITIGFISPLTGPAAQYGVPSLYATEIAIDEINANGGINGKHLELSVEDGGCDAQVAVSAARKLFDEENLRVLLGGHCSTESLAIAPLAEEREILMFASATSSPAYSQAGDFAFRNTPVNTEGLVLGDAANNAGYKTVFLLAEQTAYVQPLADAFEEHFEGKVIRESFVAEGSDPQTIITKILNSDADALVVATQGAGTGITILQSAFELGLDLPIYGNAVYDSREVPEALGDRAQDITLAYLPFDRTNPGIAAFLEEYVARHGDEPPLASHVLDAYIGTYVISYALEACDIDTACMRDFLYAYEGETPAGPITFDENGDAYRPYVLARFTEDGSTVQI